MTESYKEISAFINENIMGCHFVGVSEENEVFVKYDHEDKHLEFAAVLKLMNKFQYITRVTRVIKPSLVEAQEMLDGLNKYLEDLEGRPNKGDLLSIE